jgi:site-specific recombinase XerD
MTPTTPTAALVVATSETDRALALSSLVDSAKSYAAAARAENTLRAYRSDWLAFDRWAAARGLASLPASPSTVALYLTELADQGRKVATIGRALVAISQAHKLAGQPSPRSGAEVQEVMKGIRRRLGVAPSQKAPVLVDALRTMLAELPDTLVGARDRALLCLGFAGAFRRSELVGLDVADLAFTSEGLTVTLRRSKTDQTGEGRKVGIPYGGTPVTCPVRAVKAWLEIAGIAEGPIFRAVTRWGSVGAERLTDRAVALVVKRQAEAAGLDAARFAGHSLRAGLATSAAKAGKSERAIMAQTGHRSVTMVRRYIRDASLFSDNAAAGIGL